MSNLENDLIDQGDDLLEEEAVEMPAAGSVDTLRILEAILFASDEICTVARLKTILPGTPDGREIGKMVDQINRQLQKERHPFEIVELGGGYQFKTIAYYHPWVRQIFKDKAAKRLSIQALECLSIIAYRQPLSKAEIEAIRGVISDGAMKTLLEKRLITIVGRSEKVGRPLLYGTTADFLKYFGLNKIADLPRIEEFEALAREKFEQLPLDELKNVQPQAQAEAADEEASIEIATPQEAPAAKTDAIDEASMEVSPPVTEVAAAPPLPSAAAADEPEAEVFEAPPAAIAETPAAAPAEPEQIAEEKQEGVPAAGKKPAKGRKHKEQHDQAVLEAGVFEIAPAPAAVAEPPQASVGPSPAAAEPVAAVMEPQPAAEEKQESAPAPVKRPHKARKKKEPADQAILEAGLFEPAAPAAPAAEQHEAEVFDKAEETPAKKAPKAKKHKEPEPAPAPAPAHEEADVFEVSIKDEAPKQAPAEAGEEGVFEIK
jgi:segregation and condensation protein B